MSPLTAAWIPASLFAAALAQTPAAAPPAPGIGLVHYLVASALVFTLGIMIIVIRRNAISILMGIELLLNAAGLNFVAFSKFVPKNVGEMVSSGAGPVIDPVDGQIVTIFIIVLAAAEAALALAITLNIFNNLNTIEVDEADALKG